MENALNKTFVFQIRGNFLPLTALTAGELQRNGYRPFSWGAAAMSPEIECFKEDAVFLKLSSQSAQSTYISN